MRFGWVEFDKKEERFLTQALFFGLFFGCTIGAVVFFVLILPTYPRQPPDSFVGWASIIFKSVTILTASGWSASTVFAYVKYRRRKEKSSIGNFRKIAFALFMGFAAVPVYTAFVWLFVFLPFNLFFSEWLDPGILFSLGALLFFPFVFLFIAIALPDSKPRKILKRSYHRLRRRIHR